MSILSSTHYVCGFSLSCKDVKCFISDSTGNGLVNLFINLTKPVEPKDINHNCQFVMWSQNKY